MMVGNRIAGSLFSVLLDYAIFAFMINFLREIVKDLEDIKGDDAQGIRTLAVILGIKKTTYLLAVLSLVPIGFLSQYIYKYLLSNNLYVAIFYALALIIAPLIYFIIKITTAKEPKDFHQLSLLLKIILLLGILSILVLNLNIQYHA
jgi:4-hydroxybenzoate polyprenyltransferase